MKKSLAILAAVGVASAASAQGVEFEFSSTSVNPGENVVVEVFGDAGPTDYAIAGINFQMDADGGEWTDHRHHIPASAGPGAAQNRGLAAGSSVTGISLGQLDPTFGFDPVPGRFLIWSGDWNSDTEGVYEFDSTTARMEVYEEDEPAAGPWPRRLISSPVEGTGQVTVVPAPASLALLGLGGLAAARRRR